MRKEKLDVIPGKIHVSIDYSLFKFDPKHRNREISEKHMNYLSSRMEKNNLLIDHPIVITKDGMVIEGQHRFESAKAIGAPIYYIVAQKTTPNDVVDLATSHKNWGKLQVMNAYVAMGNPHYKKLHEFHTAVPEFPVDAAVILVGGVNSKTHDFNEGRFKVGDVNKGLEIAEYIFRLRDWMYSPEKADKFFKDRGFVLAMYQAYLSPGFNPKEFERKAKKKIGTFRKQTSPKNYRLMINQIYGKVVVTDIAHHI